MIRLICCLALAAAATGAEPSTSTFVLRVAPNATDETLRYIASLAEVRQETVLAGTPVPELLRRFYGVTFSAFEHVFRAFNPALPSVQVSQGGGEITINVPVLPAWFPATSLSSAPRNTVQQLLALHVGLLGTTTMASVAKLNPGLNGQFYDAAAAPVRVPYATGYFNIELKPELRSQVDKVYAALTRLQASGQIVRVEKTRTLRCIPHVTPASIPRTGAAAPLPSPTPESLWPFSELIAAKQNRVTIAVVDSGIDYDATQANAPDARFPYWQSPELGPDAQLQIGRVFCGPISIGCNLVTPGSFPLDDAATKDYEFHGTHVAGIALGRPVLQLKKDLDDRLQVMVLKVVDQNGQVDSGQLAEALRYAGQNGAQVVNISLSGPRAPVVEDELQALASQLFVIAAGNQSSGDGLSLDDLGDDQTVGYPARLAAALPNVITVAAHDAQSARASFSNYGRNAVHLAAPGVNILSTVGNGVYLEHSGTSQAAPLVSLTAALLLASGLPQSPAAIKRRILASVDVQPALKDIVLSHGKLNIDRALSYRYDVVTLRNGTSVKGTITSPSGLSIPQRSRAAWISIAKIVLDYSGDSGTKHYVMLRKGESFEQWIGDLDLSGFDEVVLNAAGAGETHLKTADIADITTRGY